MGKHDGEAESRESTGQAPRAPRPIRRLITRVRREFRAWRAVVPRRGEILPFLGYVFQRFAEDRCARMAAGLGYTSLLAIVPLTAIAFAMLAAFPVFEGVRVRFQDLLFANLLPQSADAMRQYFSQFVANSATLSAVGIVVLAMTAILLLGTIESDMNAIFRVTRPRKLAPRLLVFWAVITLGPLLLGASFSLSAYLYAATRWVGLDGPEGPAATLASYAPALFIVVMLMFFYLVIPNRPVRFSAALLGGVVAGGLFAALRHLFAWYLGNFPTYQTIYGALSVVPIFLVWMYLAWIVVLFGAVIAASLTEWRDAGGRPLKNPMATGPKLVSALRVLGVLHARSRHGGTTPRSRLLSVAAGGDAALDAILAQLRDSNFLDQTSRGNWVLTRDLDSATLYDLYQSLGLAFSEQDIEIAGHGWEGKIAETLAQVRADNRAHMQMSLRSLLVEEIDRAVADDGTAEDDGADAMFDEPPARASGD